MAEQSRRFNEGEDAFWDHVDDVLEENDRVMREFVTPKVTEIRRPGEIGSVAVRPTFFDLPPEPPEAA